MFKNVALTICKTHMTYTLHRPWMHQTHAALEAANASADYNGKCVINLKKVSHSDIQQNISVNLPFLLLYVYIN